MDLNQNKKIIHFGTEDSLHPKGIQEKMGLPTGAIEAEYIGIISFEGDNFIITKAISCFNNSEDKEGQILVREGIPNIYSDGSGNIFLDQTQNESCSYLEQILNTPDIKRELENGVDVNYLTNTSIPLPSITNLIDNGNMLSMIAIQHEVFEEKKELLRYAQGSFIELLEQIKSLEEKIQTYENHKTISI